MTSSSSPDRSRARGAAAGVAAVAVAAALWAVAAAVAKRLFVAGVEPLELVQARAFISVAGLACVPAAWRRGGRATWAVLGLGACIALVNAAYYLAIERLDVAVAIVLQYTGPALVVVWAALILRRAPSRDVIVCLAAATAGVVMVSGVVSLGEVRLDGLGLAFGLGAAVFFAAYTLLSERAGEAYGVVGALFRGFVIASVVWLIYQIPRGWPEALLEPANLPAVLFVGVGGTLAPFLLYVWGIQRVKAERAVIAATLEPVLAALVAWLWLGQSLSPLQLVGGATIVAAIAFMQVRAAMRPAPIAG